MNDCYYLSFRSREQKVCLCWCSVMKPGWKSRNPAWKALGRIWAKSDRWSKLGTQMLLLWRTRLGHLNISPYFLYRWQRKSHALFSLFITPHVCSYKNLLHFRSLFFLGIFLLIIIPFPPVTMPRLREVIFNHLFHQCLFLASFTNWGIVMPLPNPQSPLFLSFPLSLYHWIPSHCL